MRDAGEGGRVDGRKGGQERYEGWEEGGNRRDRRKGRNRRDRRDGGRRGTGEIGGMGGRGGTREIGGMGRRVGTREIGGTGGKGVAEPLRRLCLSFS